MSPGWLVVLALLSAQRVHIGGAATPANGIVAPEVHDMIWANGTTVPKVLTRVEPQYTAEAAQTRVTGTVVLQAVIGTDGSTKVVKVVKPLTLDLTLSAIEAIQQWTFMPATRDGKEIPVSVVVEVHFSLENR